MKKIISVILIFTLILSFFPAVGMSATEVLLASYGWDDTAFVPSFGNNESLKMTYSYEEGLNGTALKIQLGETPTAQGAYINLTDTVLKKALINEKSKIRFKFDVYTSEDYAGVGVEARCYGTTANAYDGAANPWKLYAGERLKKETWHTVEYIFDTIEEVYYSYIDGALHQPKTGYTVENRDTGLSLIRLRFVHQNKAEPDSILNDAYVMVDNMEVSLEYPASLMKLSAYEYKDNVLSVKNDSVPEGSSAIHLELDENTTGLTISDVTVADSLGNVLSTENSLTDNKMTISFQDTLKIGIYNINVDCSDVLFNGHYVGDKYSIPLTVKGASFEILSPAEADEFIKDEKITVRLYNNNMTSVALYLNEEFVEEKVTEEGICEFVINPVFGVNSIKAVGRDKFGNKYIKRVTVHCREYKNTVYQYGSYNDKFGVSLKNGVYTFTKKSETATSGAILDVRDKYAEYGVFTHISKVKMDSLDSCIKFIPIGYNENKTEVWKFSMMSTPVFNYGKLGNTNIAYKAGEWYQMKVVSDIPNRIQTVYISGEGYGPYKMEFPINCSASETVYLRREKVEATIGEGAELTDGIHFEHICHYSDINGFPVTDINSSDNIISCKALSAQFELSGNSYSSLTTDNVKLFKANEEVTLNSLDYDSEANKFKITFLNTLDKGFYLLKILPGAALNADTVSEETAVIPITVTDSSGIFTDGIELSQSGDNVVFYADYKNVSGEAKKTAAVIGMYDNDKLINVESEEKKLSEGTGSITFTLNDVSYANKLCGMLLSDVKNITPLSSAVKIDVEEEERNSIFSNEKAIQYAENSSIFMLSNDSMFLDNKKQNYESEALKPVFIDDVLMISENLINLIGDNNISWNKETGEISINEAIFTTGEENAKIDGNNVVLSKAPTVKNDVLYLPLYDVCEKVLKKYVYYDKRDFVVITDSEFEYTDSDHFLLNSEPVDEIYRFLQFDRPSGKEVINTIEENFPGKAHPRILLDKSDVEYITTMAETNEEWKAKKENWLALADRYMTTEFPVNATPEDMHGNGANYAQTYQEMMIKLGVAYLLSGDEKYAEKGITETLNVCQWENLGESYSALSSGHWMMGMAVAYDSFYNYLIKTADGRQKLSGIRKDIDRLAYRINIRGFEGAEQSLWINRNNNWVGVVGGGLLALLLSVGDEEELSDSAYLIENTLKALEPFAGFYNPDGGFFEGIGYSQYGAYLTVNALVALNRICKTDYGIKEAKGFAEMSDFFVYTHTPNSHFNFHDDSPGFITSYIPYQLGWIYNKPEILEQYDKLHSLSGKSRDILSQLYYDKCMAECDTISEVSLDKYFYGCDTGSFRNSFDSKTPTFVAFHGGYSGLNHDMLDLGQFYFEANGVAWAYDLGKDNYSLPNYFAPEGYAIYRKSTAGENCVVINPETDSDTYFGQKTGAYAKLTDFESNDKAAYASYDLTEAYERDVNSYLRGYFFGDNRNSLTIRDEISFKNSDNEIYWFMHTPATIDITSSKKAILSSGGKKLLVEISVEGAESFELLDMPAEPLPCSPVVEGQAENTNIRKLAVKASADNNIAVTVKLSPIDNGYDLTNISTTSISNWVLP
ncbi:MAG: DUF4962 domain-containing protein [Clostridia bacterium]|nr:DUF4962 domain-containing protein [Clostridia bacterium]